MSDVKAVLFDIDGTLVDSNYLHVDAWLRAFVGAHSPVDSWRIHRAIGMDSEKLLDALAGDLDETGRAWVKEFHSAIYSELKSRLRAFDGSRDLVRTLAERGTKVVLATSAPEDELASLRALLDVEDAIELVTSSDDVETAKPAPDIVQVALDRAGVDAAEAIFVGDSVWDVAAAGNASVACVGVRSGGISEGELRDAGAVAVYENVADILAHLDDSPLI